MCDEEETVYYYSDDVTLDDIKLAIGTFLNPETDCEKGNSRCRLIVLPKVGWGRPTGRNCRKMQECGEASGRRERRRLEVAVMEEMQV